MASVTLTTLPSEVLFRILTFLDVSSLLPVSRTSRLLRALSLDPLLRKARLERVRHDLQILLLRRLPKSAISPPNAWIWLSRTNVLSRSISKSLIKIRLNHSLGRRPSVDDLVERAILPACCSRTYMNGVSAQLIRRQEDVRKSCIKDRLARLLEIRPSITRVVELNIIPAECVSGNKISPKLVQTRRRVIRESLKDSLRAWVKGTAIAEQRRKEEQFDCTSEGVNVKAIARRLSARHTAAEHETSGLARVSPEKKTVQARWGKAAEMEKRKEQKKALAFGIYPQPTRAHVLGLRKFWEGITGATAG